MSGRRAIYLDSNAGAPLHPKVVQPELAATAPLVPSNRQLKIQPSRRQRGGTQAGSPQAPGGLILWELRSLKSSTDPLAKGLGLLFERGAGSALFLAISSPPPGSPVPHFIGRAAVQPRNRLSLWTGLKWDPTVVPELWNHFIKSGVVELPPPGTMTNITSNRNVVRGAFGADNSEYLTLIRAGTASACRGVIAVISKQSLADDIKQALMLLSSSPQAAAA